MDVKKNISASNVDRMPSIKYGKNMAYLWLYLDNSFWYSRRTPAFSSKKLNDILRLGIVYLDGDSLAKRKRVTS